jgi:triacylglycerol esterase/lipase EstA (alpha/beta hydrolase family)
MVRRIRVAACLAVLATGLTLPAGGAHAQTTAKDPVIVLAGLTGPAAFYAPLASRLRADGYRAYVYELPGLGTGPIESSAANFRGYVDQVRAATGAAKVDLIGHSEGGLVSRYYLKNLGGTAKVDSYISLGTPQHGTILAGFGAFYGLQCVLVPACQQMALGSPFITALNAGDETPGAVRYTTIRTLQDELVRPVDTATLSGATNVLVQARCPLRLVGHAGLALDGTVYTIARSALQGGSSAGCFAL